ncbi:hypothetical protein D3C75_1231350 [compost metagenome]
MYLNVTPARSTWSSQAFRVLGMAKLYIGAAITSTSAASSSSVSWLERSSEAFSTSLRCSAGFIQPPNKLASRCGTGLMARSRTLISSAGCAAFHWLMKVWVS